MMIRSASAADRFSDVPLTVVAAPEKVIEPNVSNGIRPNRYDGSSSIHSAEESDESYDTVVVYVWSEVSSVMVTDQVSVVVSLMFALISSPAWTGKPFRSSADAGSSS